MTHELMYSKGLEFSDHCRRNKMCMLTMDAELDKLISNLMPKGAWAKANGRSCSTLTCEWV